MNNLTTLWKEPQHWGLRYSIHPHAASLFAVALSLTISIVSSGVVSADDPSDNTDDVYGGLADLIVTRDNVSKRYAFVAIGEVHLTEEDGTPDVTPFHFLRAVDRQSSFDYAATGRHRHQVQTWYEKIRCKGKYKAALGLVNDPLRYLVKPEGVPPKKFYDALDLEIHYIDPFEDVVSLGTTLLSLQPDRGLIEATYLQRAELRSAKKITQGDVVSAWTQKGKEIKLEIKLTQSAAHGYMPTEVKFKVTEGFYKSFFSHTRTEWRKVKETWLPSRLESAAVVYRRGKPLTRQWFIQFHWLVGDNVPKEFFECDSLDYRRPFSDRFELDFDHYAEDGTLIRYPRWEPPEGLFGK